MSILKKNVENLYNQLRIPNIRKKVLLLLFISSIICIFIAAIIINYISLPPESGDLRYTWVYYLFLPIPITSLIFGLNSKIIGYSCKKNIIGGYICISFLLLLGSLRFIFLNYRQYDYRLIQDLGDEITFKFPSGKIVTNVTDYSVIHSSKIHSYSLAYFYNSNELTVFEEELAKSIKWTDINNSAMKEIEPIMTKNREGNYYLIYIKELKAFNELPEKNGVYDAYYLIYNTYDNKLQIYDYTFNYSS